MISINRIPVAKEGNKIDYWTHFYLDNERIKCDFIHDGNVVYTAKNFAHNDRTLWMIVRLANMKKAEETVTELIKKIPELKGFHVLGEEYH